MKLQGTGLNALPGSRSSTAALVSALQPLWEPEHQDCQQRGAHVTKGGHITQGRWASSKGRHWNWTSDLWECPSSVQLTPHFPGYYGAPSTLGAGKTQTASQTRISPSPWDKVMLSVKTLSLSHSPPPLPRPFSCRI